MVVDLLVQMDVNFLDYDVHLVDPEMEIVADILVDGLVDLLALDVLSFGRKVDVLDVIYLLDDSILLFVVDVVVQSDVVASLQDVLDELHLLCCLLVDDVLRHPSDADVDANLAIPLLEVDAANGAHPLSRPPQKGPFQD